MEINKALEKLLMDHYQLGFNDHNTVIIKNINAIIKTTGDISLKLSQFIELLETTIQETDKNAK